MLCIPTLFVEFEPLSIERPLLREPTIMDLETFSAFPLLWRARRDRLSYYSLPVSNPPAAEEKKGSSEFD